VPEKQTCEEEQERLTVKDKEEEQG